MGKCVLTLDELEPDRDTIGIKGVEYQLLSYDDFGLRENAAIRKLGRSVLDNMQKIADLDEAQLGKFETELDSLICKILKDIPADIVAGLVFKHKAAILTAFWQAVVTRRDRETAAAKSLTGESPLTNSSDSMAAIPTDGTPSP